MVNLVIVDAVVIYIAVEPYGRRVWPDSMIGWAVGVTVGLVDVASGRFRAANTGLKRRATTLQPLLAGSG